MTLYVAETGDVAIRVRAPSREAAREYIAHAHGPTTAARVHLRPASASEQQQAFAVLTAPAKRQEARRALDRAALLQHIGEAIDKARADG